MMILREKPFKARHLVWWPESFVLAYNYSKFIISGSYVSQSP